MLYTSMSNSALSDKYTNQLYKMTQSPSNLTIRKHHVITIDFLCVTVHFIVYVVHGPVDLQLIMCLISTNACLQLAVTPRHQNLWYVSFW